MSNEKRFTTPKGRLSFPYLFEARKGENGGKDKFSLSLIFDEEAQKTPEWAAILNEVKVLALAKFGIDQKDPSGNLVKNPDGSPKRIVPKGVRFPIRDASEKDRDDGTPMEGYEKGKKFISATSEYPPGVVGGDMQKCSPDEIYPGCFCHASVTIFSYERKDGRGVTFGLRNVQKVADGEPLGAAGGDPAKDFKPVPNYQRKQGVGSDFANQSSGQPVDDSGIPF